MAEERGGGGLESCGIQTARNLLDFKVACVAAITFLFFRRGDRTSERASGRVKERAPGVSKNLGRSGEGVNEKGEGVRRKEIAFARLTPSPCSLFLALARSFIPF